MTVHMTCDNNVEHAGRSSGQTAGPSLAERCHRDLLRLSGATRTRRGHQPAHLVIGVAPYAWGDSGGVK